MRMNYAKPVVIWIASAVECIQGHLVKDSAVNLDLNIRPTITSAYEADE
jgi:hypothetical protein